MAEWTPMREYWQLEVLGSDAYYHVDDEQMQDILHQIGELAMIVRSQDMFNREIVFSADKFSSACWCTPLTRDAIYEQTVDQEAEDKDRNERYGKDWSDD